MQTDSHVAGRLQSSLALDGGQPVRTSWLPYGHQLIDQTDIAAVTEALKSDFLTQGPRIKQFEDSVAKASSVKYAVAIANGTAALHAAYYSAGITSGDLIITAPITFAATSNAALYLGAKPLFADVDPTTGLIDVDSVARLLKSAEGKKVKAIVGIDFAGQPCHYSELEALAASHGVPFIVDAAHSLGATYQGQKAGFAGILSTMSFHPVKSITTGEGGIILTNDDKLYDKLLLFRSHGITKTKDKLTRDEGPWYHEMQELGYNYRMCDIQAALGSSQIARLPDFVKRRREIAALYRAKLAGHPNYQCATAHDDRESAYHLFPILVKDAPHTTNRRFVFEALHAENIGVQVHYIPTYQMPYYQNHVNDRDWASLCPGAEEFYQREIGLPIFPAMTDHDAEDVINALNKIASHLPK